MCSPAVEPAKASDIDIYSQTEEVYEQVKKTLIGLELKQKHENGVSVTFKRIQDQKHLLFGTPIIQLIKPIREGAIIANGTLEEIISNFDFTVIRIGLLNPTEALADRDFLHDEEKKNSQD